MYLQSKKGKKDKKMTNKKSVPLTLLACLLLTVLWIPAGLLGEFFLRLILLLSQTFWRVENDSFIPFGIFPDAGAWIMTLLRETVIVFMKVFLPLYFSSLIFKNSFKKIYWIVVNIYFFLLFCFTLLYFPQFTDNPITDKVVIYGTIIMVGVFQLISYYLLFHNKDSHQKMS